MSPDVKRVSFDYIITHVRGRLSGLRARNPIDLLGVFCVIDIRASRKNMKSIPSP